MSNRGVGARDATVSSKANGRSEAADPLDAAAQHTMDLLHRAAVSADASYQRAIEVADKLAAQLRANEDRMRELEAKVRFHHERADRAEKWLYHISLQIEQDFFASDASQPPPQQAAPRNQSR